MPVMKVFNPGFQSTIQDLGRFGFSDLGISISGAADNVSLRMGNLLLGNDQNAAALEMTLVGGEFLFESDAIIAITGSDFQPAIDGNEIPLWTSVFVDAGQKIRFGATQSGARCYLCIKDGFETESVLGSSSTHILSGIGGHNGRTLMKGDEIIYEGCNYKNLQPLKVKSEIVLELMKNKILLVTNAPQTNNFSKETLNLFTSSVYSVSEETNRMGLRLTGPPLTKKSNDEIITEGVSLGAIQISHDGNPIILFVEHQTTGGYPKIANVISAHLYKVGQLRPRDEIQFSFVSIEKAYEMRMHLESIITPMSLATA